jgi:beta-glucanase (GH16 family)
MEDIVPFKGYTPQYGYFEIRIKAVPVVGYHTALWMIGWDGNRAGEIRCFEIHGANIGRGVSRIDYGVLAWDDPTLVNECYEDRFPVDASEFHIYGVEWKPDEINFFLDNEKVRTVRQSPKYPMQFMLGIYERPSERIVGDDLWPKVCEVDYFRGYRAQ